jgi:hypothetical protein
MSASTVSASSDLDASACTLAMCLQAAQAKAAAPAFASAAMSEEPTALVRQEQWGLLGEEGALVDDLRENLTEQMPPKGSSWPWLNPGYGADLLTLGPCFLPSLAPVNAAEQGPSL